MGFLALPTLLSLIRTANSSPLPTENNMRRSPRPDRTYMISQRTGGPAGADKRPPALPSLTAEAGQAAQHAALGAGHALQHLLHLAELFEQPVDVGHLDAAA